MSLARFAFQACSFNHSDISPFRISDLRAVWNSAAQTPLQTYRSQCDLHSAVCRHDEPERRSNCVRPPRVPRSLTAILSSGTRTACQIGQVIALRMSSLITRDLRNEPGRTTATPGARCTIVPTHRKSTNDQPRVDATTTPINVDRFAQSRQVQGRCFRGAVVKETR
jgi:hypothetical protein